MRPQSLLILKNDIFLGQENENMGVHAFYDSLVIEEKINQGSKHAFQGVKKGVRKMGVQK